MKTLWRERNGVFDVISVYDIMDTITEAIALSVVPYRIIKFNFNDVIISVHAESNPEFIRRDYLRAMCGYIDKNVGPDLALLTAEEVRSDARIKKANERKRRKLQIKHEREAKTRRGAVKTKLAKAPDIELTDKAGWQEFEDLNSDKLVAFTERWAQLMQIEIANGKNVEDVAKATSQEADLENVPNSMYEFAILTLQRCWKYGSQLQCWNNLRTQTPHEDEKVGK